MSLKNERIVDTNKSLSVRLEYETQYKLQQIMEARGLSKSDAVRFAIMEVPILQIGDVTSLANEFCKIRQAMNGDNANDVVKKEVNRLCHAIYDLLVKVESQIK